MIDLLFRITLSNAGISLALAIVAVVVGKTLQRSFVRVDRNGDGELSKRECYGYLRAIE